MEYSQLCVRGLPYTLRFGDSLEVLTELRKAVILVVVVYHHEKIQIKANKGKGTIGQSPGETRGELPAVLSRGSSMDRA